MGLCEDIFQKKVISDQLCCWHNNGTCTTDDATDCYAGYPDENDARSGMLVKCHTIKDIDACKLRGNSDPARNICEQKDSLYCFGAAGLSILNKDLFPELYSAYKWAINNRTFYINSLPGVKACYDEIKREFDWCGSNPPKIKEKMVIECKDLFDPSPRDCTFQNSIYTSFNFTVFKKICKDPNWISETTSSSTVTTTSTPTPTQYSEGNSDDGLSTSDKIAIGSSIGGAFLGLIIAAIGLWYTSEIFRKHVRNLWQLITIGSSKNASTIELANRETQVQELKQQDDELKEEQPSSIEGDELKDNYNITNN